MNSRRAIYRVVQVQMPALEREPFVWIVDECAEGRLSVTNDAEAVCHELHARFPNHRIIYRDTEGKWDELLHRSGVFVGFTAARHLAPNGRAVQKGVPHV